MHLTSEEAQSLGFSVEKRAPRILAKYEGTETNVEIPESINGVTITEIGSGCFESTNIEYVTMPNTIKVIQRKAFSNTKMKEVEIPESVVEIGSEAFCDCELTSVKFNTSGKLVINGAAFADNLIEELDLTKGTYIIEGAAFNINSLRKVKFANCTFRDNPFPNNPYVKFYAEDNCYNTGRNNNYIEKVSESEDGKGVSYPYNLLIAGNETGELPEYIGILGADALRGQQIKEFNPPPTLKIINIGALAQCGLGVVKLPDSLEYIHHMAFGTDSAALPIVKANEGTNAYEAALRYGWLDVKDKKISSLTGSNIFG